MTVVTQKEFSPYSSYNTCTVNDIALPAFIESYDGNYIISNFIYTLCVIAYMLIPSASLKPTIKTSWQPFPAKYSYNMQL